MLEVNKEDNNIMNQSKQNEDEKNPEHEIKEKFGKVEDKENPKTKRNPFKWIDKEMLPVKLSYTFYYGSLGAWSPFIVIFLTSLDLNPFQSVLIWALLLIISTISTPFWAFLCDLTGRKKTIMTTIFDASQLI